MRNKREQGSISIYVVVAIGLILLLATVFVSSMTTNLLGINAETKKIESEYIAQHGLTLLKEKIYKIIQTKEDLNFSAVLGDSPNYTLKESIPNETKPELDIQVTLPILDAATSVYSLGSVERTSMLNKRTTTGGYKPKIYENYPQVQDSFTALRAKSSSLDMLEASGLGNTGLIKMTSVINPNTLVSDFFCREARRNQ